MLNKRMIGRGMLLGACAALLSGCMAVAEEKRLGDYIYVPAMTAPGSVGMIGLRVEGLTLEQDGDEQVIVESLAGAEFGVYVISSDGQLTPWANPLYPSEPMRIRTGEGETSFTLPQGTEFYLRQESAPQGYLFDSETLIPVTGEEIVVRNAMAGQLVIAAVDSLGRALAGVELTAVDEAGNSQTVRTDENGEALVLCEGEQVYTVYESALPEDAFPATDVMVVKGNGDAQGSAEARVQMANATRARVEFVHPAPGYVQLDMQLVSIDANAEEDVSPLEGVSLTVLGDEPIVMTTDEDGQASAALLSGTYDVELSYAGEEDVLLPVERGQVIVETGATTLVGLQATQSTGRVSLAASCEREISGGSVSFTSEQTGEEFGPYAMDAEGMAVSDPLAAGEYRVSFDLPDHMELGSVACGEQSAQDAEELVLTVSSGEVTRLSAHLLTRERQTFELIAAQTDDQGRMQETLLGGDIELELLDEAGQVAASVDARDGLADVEALSGVYTLRMTAEQAKALGVQPVSEVFELPAQSEAVTFVGDRARLILASVDENGMPVPGAQYRIFDSEGAALVIDTDESGEVVTPLLPAGQVNIQTNTAPDAHDTAEDMTVTAIAGQATRVTLVHPSYGTVSLSVRMQSLDEHGNPSLASMQGMSIRLYSVAQSSMTETGIVLTTGEDGSASVSLAPGEYVAQVDSQGLAAGCRAPQALRFTVENTGSVEGELVCMDALGGVRARLIGGELTDEELAQVRFELVSSDGRSVGLTMQDGAFYVGGLASGTYVLRQTQIPEGYTLAAERTVSVSGGETAVIEVPLEEYAMISVSKTGLTFDDQLRTYIVPLVGQYGVYTLVDGEMKPYPSADSQITIWSNVTLEQIAQGKAARVKLPAKLEGTTYYLHELSGVQGFGADEAYHEITLYAGGDQTVECTVSSDRGFFTFEQLDAADGAIVPGGEYELVDAQSGDVMLAFTMEENAYRNEMAIPVGAYVLRQRKAADGYALSAEPEIPVEIPPYLTQGGTMASVEMSCARVPQQEEMEDLIGELYIAEEQGLTLVGVEAGTVAAGETLIAPQMTVSVGAQSGERTNIASLVLSGVGDAQGQLYTARVEYCLAGGGWQPSDARMTGVITGPTAVSLADVKDDVSAVRVTYLNAETGEEIAGSGFTPGEMTLSVQASAQGETDMQADVRFTGVFAYRTELEGKRQLMARSAGRSLDFAMQGSGVFENVSAGRDGRISGVAFFDEDADGVMDMQETGRYAGLTVSLIAQSGEVIDTCRTGLDGSYAFDTISSGVYTVQFDAGQKVVFSSGELFSAHKISGVQDTHYGLSALVTINGDHTDYVIHVGCIYACELDGSVLERLGDETLSGLGGLSVEMRAVGADEDDEPAVVMTDDLGQFSFTGVLPGTYEVTLRVPQGYLCEQAEDGAVVRTVELEQGDELSFGEIVMAKSASVSGSVRIDDDGDGLIAENAEPLAGTRVVLLRADGGHTGQVAETHTGSDGAYSFDDLYAGEYSVLFELDGEWTFTRYGEDSDVYGAVSQSGSTKSFTLTPGQAVTGLDAGVTLPVQLTITVFKDTQYDGQMGIYEEMLEGVSLSLIRLENGADAEEITYKTDAEGTVVFTGVSPGEYVLAYRMPGQWRATKQVDAATTNYPVSCVPQSALSEGRSEPFTLSMGQSVRLYIGAMLSGSISGTVYFDDDADAVLGEDEAFCRGVYVELLDSQDAVIAATESDEDGSYAFEGLAPGRYRVRFTAAEGCGFSGTEKTMARGGVQESDECVSTTRTITVSGGAATDSADAGVVRLATVSGRIWEDRNADCAFDGEETGLEAVTVYLMNGTGRTILAAAETDAQGGFTFDGLRPGTYKLCVDAPDGYVFSGALAGGALPMESQTDGRAYSVPFTLRGGVKVETIGYGVLTQGAISGRIWNDTDYDGLLGESEAGLRGVTLTLQSASGETFTTQTIRSGEFSFGELMPGEYTLSVELGEGYVFTADGGDSLVPRTDSRSVSLYLGALEMGEALSGVNIGALEPASVGGIVWYDQDNDGRRQTSDAGVSGVRVTLTILSGRDAGKTYATATDETGAYRFDGVMPGAAQLTFELDQGYAFAKNVSGTKRVSSVPQADAVVAQSAVFDVSSGVNQTDMDVGVVGVGTVSGIVWEDSTYDGRRGADERGVSGAEIALLDAASGEMIANAVTDENGAYAIEFVRVGEYAVQVTLPGGRVFTTEGESAVADIDAAQARTETFSLAMGESRSGLDVGAIIPSAIRGRLAVDADEDGVAGEEEAGLADAVVTVMQGGTVVATVKTGADGSFAFDLLRPGTYRLRFTLPEETLFASGVALNLMHADAQEGESGSCTLAMGDQAVLTAIPVVRAAKIAGRAWIDEDVNGRIGPDEEALTDVMAELLDENGQVLGSQWVSDEGAYAFDQLRSGVYTVRFTLPEEMLFTECTGEAGGSSVAVVPGNVGSTAPFSLSMGEQKLDLNIGGILPGEIGDSVFMDTNGNGLQDYKEPLVPGVRITLLHVQQDGSMEEYAATVSDEYGYYRFSALRPGTYVVRLDAQPGDVLTVHFGEPLGEIDSDLDPETGLSDPIALRSGQTLLNVDIGLIEHEN